MGGVVPSAPDEGRDAARQEGQAEEIQTRHHRDPALAARIALLVEGVELQPTEGARGRSQPCGCVKIVRCRGGEPWPPIGDQTRDPFQTARRSARIARRPMSADDRDAVLPAAIRMPRTFSGSSPKKIRAPSEGCRQRSDFKAERLAGGPGFEPRLTESESAVLPLNYPPAGSRVSLLNSGPCGPSNQFRGAFSYRPRRSVSTPGVGGRPSRRRRRRRGRWRRGDAAGGNRGGTAVAGRRDRRPCRGAALRSHWPEKLHGFSTASTDRVAIVRREAPAAVILPSTRAKTPVPFGAGTEQLSERLPRRILSDRT